MDQREATVGQQVKEDGPHNNMRYEVPVVYRGQCSYIIEADSPAEAKKVAEAQFKDGVEPDVLGNESEEVDRIGEPIELTNDDDWDKEWDQQ